MSSHSSFEFLADHQEWEANCLKDLSNIDRLPDSMKKVGSQAWTFPALLLATLLVHKDKPINTISPASAAQNGGTKKECAGVEVSGYAGIATKCDAYNRDSTSWYSQIAPKPALLDTLPMGCLLFKFEIEFTSPFYSRDDMPFYPTDNALKRHKIFDAPYLAASGIKGLLRWASHTRRASLQDDAIDNFLFGVIREGSESDLIGSQGALYCYPFFFSGGRIGLEVINPQNRETGAGTLPIKYEVVKAGARGTLWFLLTNLPGRKPLSCEHVYAFLEDVKFLLEFGGLSAKSSASWGKVSLSAANFAMRPRVENDETTGHDGEESIGTVVDEQPKAQASKVQVLYLYPQERFEAARKAVSNGAGDILNPNKKNNAKLYTKEIYTVLGFHPEGEKLRKKEEEYRRINENWKIIRKPYEEVRAWVEEENKRLAAEGEERLAEAEEKERKRLEAAAAKAAEHSAREAKEREERKKAKWILTGLGTRSFDDLKKALMQAMLPNKEQTA